MYFYKFIKNEYHPLTSAKASVRLGSFEYYRDIENLKIQDQNEGTLQYDPNGVTFDASNIGNTPLNHGIRLENGARIIINGIKVKSYFPNSLIFCLSYFEEYPNESDLSELSRSLDYDAHYQICDINKFAAICANKIYAQLNVNKVGVDLNHLSIFEVAQIKVRFEHGPVKYLDDISSVVENEQDNHSGFERQLEHLFRKESKFKNDGEYRIVFFITLGDRVLPFKERWLDIPANIFDGVLL